ncbi:Pectinesterase [Rhynchospora pubera]|uniref:Pectinesterase n=1 Tax=Rhynchospora pubera TaxID=906938 RepID=A0AAV8FTQ6_9POAL|nr:Pectinesterase [Rhynchospora pubera]
MSYSQCFTSKSRRPRFILLTLLTIFLVLIAAASIAFLIRTRFTPENSGAHRVPTEAIKRACGFTMYKDICMTSLMEFPGGMEAGPQELVHLSMNMTHQRVSQALYDAMALAAFDMAPLSRSAYDSCMELLYDSHHHLAQSLATSLSSSSSPDDVLTWLSAVVTNQDTCEEEIDQSGDAYLKPQMMSYFNELAELLSNNLAIYTNQDFSTISTQNKKRRKLLSTSDRSNEFPNWVKRSVRRLLQVPAFAIQADMVVSKDGNGTHKNIGDAIKAVPNYNPRRVIIYVKAGRYEENVKVDRKKTNIMFIGDGVGKTVVSGGRSVYENYTTYSTATFAANGAGFIMKDMTIENWAGPEKHQAVALRVSADHAVIYSCKISGYQDTLYVHSQRQFYRECDIYGTVDFIFGNAAVVLQNCNIWARKPLPQQKNTITAQSRKDPNQNTGISIHACRLWVTSELYPVKWEHPTYLGRPWKMYSRTVYMETYMDDHINQAGWLEWNGSYALQTLYYGEYMNNGPGSWVGKRVTWPGYRVITMHEEASKFTVAQFIGGFTWLPPTGVSFLAGLRGK